MIDEKERQKRKESVKNAIASMKLSGFTISAESERELQSYVNGEINLTQLVEGTIPDEPIDATAIDKSSEPAVTTAKSPDQQ